MRGVITRAQVLAHPIVILESFGVKVLVRALFADARETFLEIVSRAAEEEAHRGLDELALSRTVNRFIGLERRVGEVYRALADRFSDDHDAAAFFATLASHEEGHALVLSRVRREIRKGKVWKRSRDIHVAAVDTLDARLAGWEEEINRRVSLARAFEIVEGIEGSEINVVFDTLNESVDMRSRTRFERFFVLTGEHLAYCANQIRSLRARHRPARSAAFG